MQHPPGLGISGVRRRRVVLGLALAGAGGLAAGVQAQERPAAYPAKLVKIIVPYPGGNLPDAVARQLAESFGQSFGQTFVVDNRPGASGVVAIDAVARSAPDGYTLLMGDPGPIVIAPAQNRAQAQALARDIMAVSLIATSHFYLVVPSGLGVSSLPELVALARARPGVLNYASTGQGNIHHLMAETLKAEAGIDLVHVPYKGGPQGAVALLAGEVSVMFSSLAAISAHVTSGAVKVLAVASPRRSEQRPDVPTFAELGYPAINFRGDFGLFAPSGCPAAVVRTLATAVQTMLQDGKVVERLARLGVEPIGSTPEAASAYWRGEAEKYARAVKLVGLAPN